MSALDTLVNPPFANDPPVKLNLDAKVVGLVVAILAGVIALVGGWQMYKGNESGKRLAIYGLAIAFAAEVIWMIGFASGSGILQLILLALLYYAVVVSRFPGEAPSTSASRGV